MSLRALLGPVSLLLLLLWSCSSDQRGAGVGTTAPPGAGTTGAGNAGGQAGAGQGGGGAAGGKAGGGGGVAGATSGSSGQSGSPPAGAAGQAGGASGQGGAGQGGSAAAGQGGVTGAGQGGKAGASPCTLPCGDVACPDSPAQPGCCVSPGNCGKAQPDGSCVFTGVIGCCGDEICESNPFGGPTSLCCNAEGACASSIEQCWAAGAGGTGGAGPVGGAGGDDGSWFF